LKSILKKIAHSNIMLALPVLLYGFIVLWGLGEGSLRDWDEAWYGTVARTMVRTGEYLIPHYNGVIYHEKPPLFYWMIASCYQVFGFNEFAVRLPSALCGLACLLIIMLWYREVVGAGARVWWPALVLLTIPHFLRYAGLGQMDVPMAFLLTASLYAFWKASKNPWYYLLAGAFWGSAVLMKWVVGFWPSNGDVPFFSRRTSCWTLLTDTG